MLHNFSNFEVVRGSNTGKLSADKAKSISDKQDGRLKCNVVIKTIETSFAFLLIPNAHCFRMGGWYNKWFSC